MKNTIDSRANFDVPALAKIYDIEHVKRGP
jgi:hypothetical protein